MTIDKKREDGRLTLAVAGRLDTNTAPQLEAEVKLDGVTEVVFDLAGLEYVSSAGLRVFMATHKAMAACGGAMKVRAPNEMVRGVFQITGLDAVFTIEP